MFTTGSNSAAYQNESRTETGNEVPHYSSYQNNPSSTFSPNDASGLSRPLPESEMIAREIREGTLSGFVGASTKISADVSFKSLLRIDGLVSGRITSDEGTLVVAAAGRVEANVTVAIARVNGTVTGDIVCTDRIELGAAAKVTGNIQAPTLLIELGAVLDGLCRMTMEKAELVSRVEPPTAAVGERIAAIEPVVDALVVSAPPLVAEPALAEVTITKPKIARKANVMSAKPRSARTKAARAKTVDQEASGEQSAAAAR